MLIYSQKYEGDSVLLELLPMPRPTSPKRFWIDNLNATLRRLGSPELQFPDRLHTDDLKVLLQVFRQIEERDQKTSKNPAGAALR